MEDTPQALKGTTEEANAAKAKKTEAVPSAKQVEKHNLDHSVFRSWCPRCVKGRAAAYGNRASKNDQREVPVVGVDYVHTRSEQEQEEEEGMPILHLKDEGTKMITGCQAQESTRARWSPSDGCWNSWDTGGSY